MLDGAHHREEHRRRRPRALPRRPDGARAGWQDSFSRRIQRATELLSKKAANGPYDAVIVDETQDLDVQRLALIRLLAGKGRDSLTLLGDMNQRIYGEPLDLEELHISVEGRTLSLAAGYRTTREIAELGQRLLPAETGAVPDIAPTLDAPASGVSGPLR